MAAQDSEMIPSVQLPEIKPQAARRRQQARKAKNEIKASLHAGVAKPPAQCKRAARKAVTKTPSPSHAASTGLLTPPPSKRKATVEADATEGDQSNGEVETSSKKTTVQGTKQKKLSWTPKENRAKPFIEVPPKKVLDKLRFADMERTYVVGYQAKGLKEGENPEITFDFVGSTGNLYKTVIRKVPSCNCPDKRFRPQNPQCKHIIYALVHTLKAPAHLQYQAALLASEINEMWQECSLSQVKSTSTEDNDGKRKPIEGDCPICFMELKTGENTVWCQSSCGNNVHKACFDQWAIRSRLTSSGVRCVYCRAEWGNENEKRVDALRKNAVIGPGGYRNVGFGLDLQRGMNTTL
ncbi:hypothetical protein N7478_006803 [Penicillium angulare]|uniref:uncharacterized protein n=1 Tax=Penicillium angulare TaxID=116970 RepID=UPI002541E299|nr:uncharacterized protein N7478_006803 [Penicillium angulare]KAJ5281431.1 hypothetical protein N7478_006803 [Penicillium angulare]